MVLRIPDAGLQLESSAQTTAALPVQAFAVTLSDSVIEDMIECWRNEQDIQLSLGSSPTFLYGSQVHRLNPIPDSFTCDLYLTDTSEPEVKACRLPNPTMSLFRHVKPLPFAAQQPTLRAERTSKDGKAISKPLAKPGKNTSKPSIASASSSKSASDVQTVFEGKADDALEKLKNAFAQYDEKKQENSATVVSGVIPTSKNGRVKAGKTKLLPGKSTSLATTTIRSMPTSPALSGVGSPSLLPAGGTTDKTKQQRAPIIHELAVQSRSHDYLFGKWGQGSRDEFQVVLSKVATFDDSQQAWTLKKASWRDLDVYNYPYSSEEERKAVIENAIRQYDRMRLGASEPVWDRLLPKEERGTGKCLSRLQATFAKNAANASTAKAPRADGSSGSGDSEPTREDESTARPNIKAKGGEAMARSNSQPMAGKSKKISEREAQTKRLLSNPKKTAPQKTTTTPKVSPTKPAQKGTKDKGGRILSKEFVSDSDSDDDEVPLSTTLGKTKITEKPKVAVAPKPKPAPKPAAIKAEVIARPIKRPREEEDDSSSSGTPLSKRLKLKEQKPKESVIRAAPPLPPVKHRTSDASQNSRATSSGNSHNKSKNTSPAKSSPLASSPPTNASDLEQSQENIVVSKKRKIDADAGGKDKRPRVSSSTLSKAHKYRVFYPTYEAMHWKVVNLDNPPPEMVRDLLDMRERLEKMKAEIYKEVAPV